MSQRNNGFTLIELLVVIAIIALLSTTVMASLNSARSKSRDAKRVAEIQEMQTALELYFSTYNRYPVSLPNCPGSSDPWCRDSLGANWIPGLIEFMSPLPHSPSPTAWAYHYYSPSPAQYWLMIQLENQTEATCGGGAVYLWFDGTSNTCAWWGPNLYVRAMK